MIALVAALLLGAAPAGAGDEIVVTARRRKCDVSVADRVLSNTEFRAHAADWAAGRPVRVRAATDVDVKCLAKVVFRLQDAGVRLIQFVQPGDTELEHDGGALPDMPLRAGLRPPS